MTNKKKQQLINEYNNIAQMKPGPEYNNAITDFIERNNIVGLQVTNASEKLENPDLKPLIRDVGKDLSEAHLYGIQRSNGKYDVLPKIGLSYEATRHNTQGLKELFSTTTTYDRGVFDVKLNDTAVIELGENGEVKIGGESGHTGKLELHQHGSYYGTGKTTPPPESASTHNTENPSTTSSQSNEQDKPQGGKPENTSQEPPSGQNTTQEGTSQEQSQKHNTNEQTSTPSTKPEGTTETPVSTESPQTTHTNTSSKPSYDFNNAKQNMIDEVNGISAQHRSLTDPKKREFRRSSMQDEDVVNTKRFYKAREYYKQNRDRIQAIDEHLNNARASFSEQEQKELLSDKNIKNINKALNEAKAEYDSAVLDAKRAGTKVPEYDSKNINKQVAQKVFGNTNIESINAVQYADLKTTGDNLKARFQRRNDIIGRAIDPALKRNENKIARGPRAGSSGWKGKAAIFGGVALGALALVGVASMVMSGGRQQNSNLYNPYQAMY